MKIKAQKKAATLIPQVDTINRNNEPLEFKISFFLILNMLVPKKITVAQIKKSIAIQIKKYGVIIKSRKLKPIQTISLIFNSSI